MQAVLDAFTGHRDDLRRLDALTAEQRDDLRREAMLRLASGELTPSRAVAVLRSLEVEMLVPELVRLLRSGSAPLAVRSAALDLLRYTAFDVYREVEALDAETAINLVGEAAAIARVVEMEAQKGTPFERLAAVDWESDDDTNELVDELLEAFYASSEAAASDADDLRFWAAELVRLGVGFGFGSPASWSPASIDELLSELLPRKVTIANAAEAMGAVAAFRMFFRWAARVAVVPDAAAIDTTLQELEPDFPSMMMDSRRFGIAKSFITQGLEAGYDMSTEEGLHAFQEQWNRDHARSRIDDTARKKLDAAKKRKAKMAKLSRRKNRRKK